MSDESHLDGIDVEKILPDDVPDGVVDVTEVLADRVGEWTTPGWVAVHAEISDSYTYKILKALNDAGIIGRRKLVSGEVEYRLPTKEQRLQNSMSQLMRRFQDE